METIRKYKISENYQAVVEVDTPAMWLYIERKYKVFFGLIPWSEQYGHAKGFVLGDQPDGSKIYSCYSRPGRISRSGAEMDYRNIDTFDLEVEISKLFHSVMKIEAENERKEKLFQYKLNNILNNDTQGTMG